VAGSAYLIRRAGTSLVILIGISIFIFILLHSVFPSPAIVVLGPKAIPQAVAEWNAQNGYEDYPVMIAYTLIAAVLTVLGNLLADIALTIADPRIRLS
jgi:ABC-type dipeptide/oligopeptide/nickel transport system permease component